MKIALFGVRGMIGSRIAAEAVRRGHALTAVLRDTAHPPSGLPPVPGDALNAESVAKAVRGQDAVVSAVGPGTGPPSMLSGAAHALIAGLRQAEVKRLVIVGGAGSLEVKPGLALVDTPDFPAAWKPAALAHREALAIYRGVTDLDWTYVSPAALIEPGVRTGRYRLGFDALLVDKEGRSRISAEDFAVAILDEIERPEQVRKRITVAEESA